MKKNILLIILTIFCIFLISIFIYVVNIQNKNIQYTIIDENNVDFDYYKQFFDDLDSSGGFDDDPELYLETILDIDAQKAIEIAELIILKKLEKGDKPTKDPYTIYFDLKTNFYYIFKSTKIYNGSYWSQGLYIVVVSKKNGAILRASSIMH